MSLATSYGFLLLAVILGVTSNSFAKSAEGFTLLFPSIITGITIVLCMYALSMVMKNIPMGITYASFAGLAIIATVIVGVIKYNQMPNLYTIIGLGFIIGAKVIAANNATGKANNQELKYPSIKPLPMPVFTAVITPLIITLIPNDIKIINKV